MKFVTNELIWALENMFEGNSFTLYFENLVSEEGFYIVRYGIQDKSEMGYSFNSLIDDETEGLDYQEILNDLMELKAYLENVGYEVKLNIDIKGGYLK